MIRAELQVNRSCEAASWNVGVVKHDVRGGSGEEQDRARDNGKNRAQVSLLRGLRRDFSVWCSKGRNQLVLQECERVACESTIG